jgi:hypothetical protein
MAANEASGLSAETGMDPATGGVAQPGLRLIVGELADA